MNAQEQIEFDETLREGRQFLLEYRDAITADPKDHHKIAEIKGRVSKKIERLDQLDSGYRIGSGIIPDNWDGN